MPPGGISQCGKNHHLCITFLGEQTKKPGIITRKGRGMEHKYLYIWSPNPVWAYHFIRSMVVKGFFHFFSCYTHFFNSHFLKIREHQNFKLHQSFISSFSGTKIVKWRKVCLHSVDYKMQHRLRNIKMLKLKNALNQANMVQLLWYSSDLLKKKKPLFSVAKDQLIIGLIDLRILFLIRY